MRYEPIKTSHLCGYIAFCPVEYLLSQLLEPTARGRWDEADVIGQTDKPQLMNK